MYKKTEDLQRSEYSTHSIEAEDSIPYSQNPPTCPYFEPREFGPLHYTHFI